MARCLTSDALGGGRSCRVGAVWAVALWVSRFFVGNRWMKAVFPQPTTFCMSESNLKEFSSYDSYF